MFSAAQKEAWIAKAESLKPVLQQGHSLPQSLIGVQADPAGFQGWRTEPTGTVETFFGLALSRGDSLVLDFGAHLVGFLHFALQSTVGFADAPTRLKLTFGETLAEVAEPFDPYAGSLSRAWLQDETVNIDALPQTVRLPRRYAFQFLQIEVVDTSSEFAVQFTEMFCETVTSANRENALPPPADLPPDLAALDQVSLRTLQNCMQTVFEDGPKRDRRLWLGDLRLQALADQCSFQNYPLVRRCLYLFAGLARDDGLVPACVYEAPYPHAGGNNILDYAVLFGPTLRDYAEASGDWETARALWPVALRQFEFALNHVNADGLFVDPGDWWIFIDWQANLDKQASMHSLLLYCLRETLALAQAIDRAADAAFIPPLMARMTEAARRFLWDDAQKLFASGPSRQISWASQAWMVLGGVVGKNEGAALFAQLAQMPEAVRPAGPYLFHHIVEAMLQCGLTEDALTTLRSYWGGMIERGATTFWEVFDPGDDHLSPYGNHQVNSYCHAWSCTPAYFLRRHSLR